MYCGIILFNLLPLKEIPWCFFFFFWLDEGLSHLVPNIFLLKTEIMLLKLCMVPLFQPAGLRSGSQQSRSPRMCASNSAHWKVPCLVRTGDSEQFAIFLDVMKQYFFSAPLNVSHYIQFDV